MIKIGSQKAMKPMLNHFLNSATQRAVLLLMVSALMMACANNRQTESDLAIEPSFQERVTECSKIADRSERDRCLYE